MSLPQQVEQVVDTHTGRSICAFEHPVGDLLRHTGSVTVTQRFGSTLNLNPHYHREL